LKVPLLHPHQSWDHPLTTLLQRVLVRLIEVPIPLQERALMTLS
jgi:hypothetical protein